jgi:hypothetical protein
VTDMSDGHVGRTHAQTTLDFDLQRSEVFDIEILQN